MDYLVVSDRRLYDVTIYRFGPHGHDLCAIRRYNTMDPLTNKFQLVGTFMQPSINLQYSTSNSGPISSLHKNCDICPTDPGPEMTAQHVRPSGTGFYHLKPAFLSKRSLEYHRKSQGYCVPSWETYMRRSRYGREIGGPRTNDVGQ